MCRILRISGDSLVPDYHPGDFVLVCKIPFLIGPIKPGDTVAFRHPDHGTMIKKVVALVPDNRLFVVGTGRHSVDSRRFGPIEQDTLIGRVIWHLRSPDRPR
jgi:phage repressor protein C with HTH and peptisase S24 domain